jgi:hypothetical protein
MYCEIGGFCVRGARTNGLSTAGAADGSGDAGPSGTALGGASGENRANASVSGAGGRAAAMSGGGGGGSAGVGGGGGEPASSNGCSTEGVQRCVAGVATRRERCSGGQWTADTNCDAGSVCRANGPNGTVSCVVVADVCRGSEGKTVCDSDGKLTVCNPDGTPGTQQTCNSAKLCQAGLSAGSCPTCLAGTDHRCSGAMLEVCAPDGKSWSAVSTCTSASLCNDILGKCTSMVCDPGKFACKDNSLMKCNAAGSAFESMMACGKGSCDAAGGDCNICEPGSKSCDATTPMTVLTCNALGEGYDMKSCAAGTKCVGAGQCVQCSADADCGGANRVCQNSVCVCVPQCTGKQCGADGCGGVCGSCTSPKTCNGSGQCTCVPQCNGKQCGPDGCGSSCGSCTSPATCNASGQCACVPQCNGKQCGPDGCNSSCGSCTSPATCNASGQCACVPQCSGKQCGPDGCNGSCGSCTVPAHGSATCSAAGACSFACDSGYLNCPDKTCNPLNWTFESGTSEGWTLNTLASTASSGAISVLGTRSFDGTKALRGAVLVSGSNRSFEVEANLCPGGNFVNMQGRSATAHVYLDGPELPQNAGDHSADIYAYTSSSSFFVTHTSSVTANTWLTVSGTFSDADTAQLMSIAVYVYINGTTDWSGTVWVDGVHIQ